MQSKNKKRQTLSESEHVSQLDELPCVVCRDPGLVEIHEFEQGDWYTSVPLCVACHRGPEGWHGTRQRWTRNRCDMLTAINRAHKWAREGVQ